MLLPYQVSNLSSIINKKFVFLIGIVFISNLAYKFITDLNEYMASLEKKYGIFNFTIKYI